MTKIYAKLVNFHRKLCKIVINDTILIPDFQSDRFHHSKLLESDFELSKIQFRMANRLSLLISKAIKKGGR